MRVWGQEVKVSTEGQRERECGRAGQPADQVGLELGPEKRRTPEQFPGSQGIGRESGEVL